MREITMLKCDRAPLQDAEMIRAQTLRRELPWQQVIQQLDQARLHYRTLFYGQVARAIRHTLPWKLFRKRQVHVWQIDNYPRFIPDAVLLKWEEARHSLLFQSFWVLEPAYGTQREIRDPWLIGKINGPYYAEFEPKDEVSIIAYWE